MTSLSEDAKIVRECGLNVRVAKRDAQGARWETVAELHDLEEAVAVAAEVDARQSAVFVGGYFYWTSDDPDVFNSGVLSHASARPVRLDSFPHIHWNLQMRVKTQAKAQKVFRWFAKHIGQELIVLECERHWTHKDIFVAYVRTPLGVVSVEEAVFRALQACQVVTPHWVVTGPVALDGGMWEFSGLADSRNDPKWPISSQVPGLIWASFVIRNYENVERAIKPA